MSSQEKVIDDPTGDELNELLKRTTVGSVQWKWVKKILFTQRLCCILEKTYNFDIRDEDIVVCSLPKSGTTWLQEMVWCITNELDFEKAKRVDLNERFPHLEYSGLVPRATFEKHPEIPIHACLLDSFDYVRSLDGRRFIKTHLPLNFLPERLQGADRKSKMLYVYRDPRDVCVSYFHHWQLFFNGSFEEYVKLFIGGHVLLGPYWNHVLPYWENRNQQNLLLVRYEDMKRDLPDVIRRVAAFLDKTLTPEQVSSLADHLSFESMKNNKAVNGDLKDKNGRLHSSFLRTGQSGGFRKNMTPEQLQAFDVWIEKSIEGTDFVMSDI